MSIFPIQQVPIIIIQIFPNKISSNSPRPIVHIEAFKENLKKKKKGNYFITSSIDVNIIRYTKMTIYQCYTRNKRREECLTRELRRLCCTEKQTDWISSTTLTIKKKRRENS
jgi:hypothetical protein